MTVKQLLPFQVKQWGLAKVWWHYREWIWCSQVSMDNVYNACLYFKWNNIVVVFICISFYVVLLSHCLIVNIATFFLITNATINHMHLTPFLSPPFPRAHTHIHRNLAQDLMSECYSSLKTFLDEKIRQRKPVSITIDSIAHLCLCICIVGECCRET